ALLLISSAHAAEPRRDRFGDPLPDGAIARLGTVHAHPGVDTIAFSADGKTLITTSANVVRRWDAATGRVIKVIERPAPRDAVNQIISDDGRTTVIRWPDRLEIREVGDDRLRHTIHLPAYQSIWTFVLSPRGELVIVSLGLP